MVSDNLCNPSHLSSDDFISESPLDTPVTSGRELTISVASPHSSSQSFPTLKEDPISQLLYDVEVNLSPASPFITNRSQTNRDVYDTSFNRSLPTHSFPRQDVRQSYSSMSFQPDNPKSDFFVDDADSVNETLNESNCTSDAANRTCPTSVSNDSTHSWNGNESVPLRHGSDCVGKNTDQQITTKVKGIFNNLLETSKGAVRSVTIIGDTNNSRSLTIGGLICTLATLFIGTFLILLMFVILPNIVQNGMVNSRMELLSATITEPAARAFNLEATVSISRNTKISATIQPLPIKIFYLPTANNNRELGDMNFTTNGRTDAAVNSNLQNNLNTRVELLNDSSTENDVLIDTYSNRQNMRVLSTSSWVPIGGMHLPDMELTGRMSSMVFNATFYLRDYLSNFDDFLEELMQQGSADWLFDGRANVKALGMTFQDLEFIKRMTVQGPKFSVGDKLIKIRELDLSRSTRWRARLRIVVEYTNLAKVAIVPIGDIAFDAYYKHLHITTLYGIQISLLQGLNVLEFIGDLAPGYGINREFSEYKSDISLTKKKKKKKKK